MRSGQVEVASTSRTMQLTSGLLSTTQANSLGTDLCKGRENLGQILTRQVMKEKTYQSRLRPRAF